MSEEESLPSLPVLVALAAHARAAAARVQTERARQVQHRVADRAVRIWRATLQAALTRWHYRALDLSYGAQSDGHPYAAFHYEAETYHLVPAFAHQDGDAICRLEIGPDIMYNQGAVLLTWDTLWETLLAFLADDEDTRMAAAARRRALEEDDDPTLF